MIEFIQAYFSNLVTILLKIKHTNSIPSDSESIIWSKSPLRNCQHLKLHSYLVTVDWWVKYLKSQFIFQKSDFPNLIVYISWFEDLKVRRSKFEEEAIFLRDILGAKLVSLRIIRCPVKWLIFNEVGGRFSKKRKTAVF